MYGGRHVGAVASADPNMTPRSPDPGPELVSTKTMLPPAAPTVTRYGCRCRNSSTPVNGPMTDGGAAQGWPDDGGPFVTNPDKNVTWTILALAMRTSEYIANQRKAGAI